MTGRIVSCLVLTWALGAACGRSSVPIRGSVERLAVEVEPADDGSVRIREAFTLRPDAAGAIRFRRHAETAEADGLLFVSAAVDGVPASAGKRGFSVESIGANGVATTWETTGEAGMEHQFALEYRAISAVAVTEPRARLSWPLLTSRRGYDVGRVDVVFGLPAASRTYDGTGIAEAGWVVERTSNGITATRTPVVAAESATLVAEFDFDRSRVRDPVWERNRDRQRQFLPALFSGAIFFLVVGVGTLVILRMQYPSKSRTTHAGHGPGPSDEDRAVVVSGLRVSGLAGGGAAVVSAVVAEWTLGFLGPWRQVIPASMLIVSIGFLLASPWYRR